MGLEKHLVWKRVIKKKCKVEHRRWFQSKHMERQLDYWEEQASYANSTDDSKVKDLIVNGEGWNKGMIEFMFFQEICKEILNTPARTTWFGAECQWTPTVETVSSIENWLVECIRNVRAGGGEEQKKRISKLGFLMWEIWKTRNSKLFQQEEVNHSWTINKAKALEATYWKLSEKQQSQKTEANRSKTNLVKWRPPPQNWLKANVDATLRKDTETGAIAAVIRDSKGRIILGFSGKIQAKSSTVAEAQAIRQALIIVNNLQMGRTLIESDNLKLVQVIKSKTTLAEAMAIIQDIQILM
ncbi:uncharacterized protein LOC110278262 [Arachis duranensis]|uniref:Uncharacterized protein LOC110278262 n=1 Tax=Arachis duranensis TaxID=130453 RepID=A0A6P5N4C5_ARADU|nr:uncharacterized protein LOC110278262 [Arachis duranensis]